MDADRFTYRIDEMKTTKRIQGIAGGLKQERPLGIRKMSDYAWANLTYGWLGRRGNNL